MKKLFCLMLVCMFVLISTVSVFAAEEGRTIQPRAQLCGNCDRMSLNIVALPSYETGPVQVKCIHGKPYGSDTKYTIVNSAQYKCSYCSYKSAAFSRPNTYRYNCHGSYS